MLFTMSGVVSRRPDKWRHQVSEFQGDGKENIATELRQKKTCFQLTL
jgi:hypothetical protein